MAKKKAAKKVKAAALAAGGEAGGACFTEPMPSDKDVSGWSADKLGSFIRMAVDDADAGVLVFKCDGVMYARVVTEA